MANLEDRVLTGIAALERRKVFANMVETRGHKYAGIIRGMQTFRWLMLLQTKGNFVEAKRRGEILITFYAAMRWVDDIIDGDVQLPASEKSRIYYVDKRLEFVNGGMKNPTDTADWLLLHSASVAKKLGFQITGETSAILNSMRFDAQRIDQYALSRRLVTYPASELQGYFHDQDITGTVSGMLKLFDEPPSKTALLAPIGNAHRLYLTIKDFPKDLKAGLVNIPAEDCERLQIRMHDLEKVAAEADISHPAAIPLGIRKWLAETARNGLELLDYHKSQVLPKNSLNYLGRFVLWFMYQKQAEKALRRAFETYAL